MECKSILTLSFAKENTFVQMYYYSKLWQLITIIYLYLKFLLHCVAIYGIFALRGFFTVIARGQ
jgi:hypothetical protein